LSEKITTLGAPTDKKNGRRPGNRPEYQIFPRRRIVLVKFGKRTTEREIASYALSLRIDPLFQPEFSEIVDLRDVKDLDLNGAEMMDLADNVDPFSYEAKRAFVVGDSVQGHAARMHQILRIAKENLIVVHSVEEAERWIEKTPIPGERKASASAKERPPKIISKNLP
jgi:hypothetical protein